VAIIRPEHGRRTGNSPDRSKEQLPHARRFQGLPFVGPAGKLLDRALGEAGIDRASVYVANFIKPFKFEERGKCRIHKKPNKARRFTHAVHCEMFVVN